jgi:hypothetical protein
VALDTLLCRVDLISEKICKILEVFRPVRPGIGGWWQSRDQTLVERRAT